MTGSQRARQEFESVRELLSELVQSLRSPPKDIGVGEPCGAAGQQQRQSERQPAQSGEDGRRKRPDQQHERRKTTDRPGEIGLGDPHPHAFDEIESVEKAVPGSDGAELIGLQDRGNSAESRYFQGTSTRLRLPFPDRGCDHHGDCGEQKARGEDDQHECEQHFIFRAPARPAPLSFASCRAR